ncbi:MAG: Asp/Glu/hydantoin racemase [Alphaproteobacteria bacterium]|nr:Asp/Glu/hydantoin racemase [Alphaproteobacteria bacterium]
MRLLFVNPNITPAITEIMAAEALRSAAPGTEIVPATARFGPLYIANRIEAAIAGHAVLEVLAERAAGFDAAIVAAFGDPGLHAAKELLDIPVVGVSEAAFHFAYMLGKRYSLVCLTERLRVWAVECAEEHGLSGRLAGSRALTAPIADITRAQEQVGGLLLAECQKAVAEDRAEVVILAGGPAAGLARKLQERVPVPLLDGVRSAVHMAEALVRLSPPPARAGSMARPAPKPTQGLSAALTRALEGEAKG